MKKYLIFNILSLIFLLSALPMAAERKFDIHPTKKIEANPINVAAILTQLPDSAAVASTLQYYGYVSSLSSPLTPAPSTPETLYTNSNGSTISFSFNKAADGKEYSTIEVTSKVSAKERDKILLQDLNFTKIGNSYERKSVGFTTRCTHGHRGSLIFQQQPKARE